MRIISIFAFSALWASAQQPAPAVKFRAQTNLVVIDVSVRDRARKPIEGLKKEDFTVLEDGKPQQIAVFEFQRLTGEPVTIGKPHPQPRFPEYQSSIRTSAPGTIRYQDRRLIALFFDVSSMPVEDQMRAQQAALKFIQQQMTPADLVSVMTFSVRLKVATDFTDDRESLVKIIRSFRLGEGSELAVSGETGDPDSGEETGAAFIADETEFNLFNTDRKLSALESAVRMLAALPEKKALVYFSSGVGKTGVENLSQLRSTVNAAVRSNVSFYPVDARGLGAVVPGGDATMAAPRGIGIFSGQAQRKQMDAFRNQQDTLYTLAADTGGKALVDNNDLTAGIRQAQRDIGSYYVLGYYSKNPAEDGRFRRLQIKLTGQPQARLEHRSGYFAAKQWRKLTASDRERQLEDAITLGDPVTDLRLALETNYFRLSREQYFVPLAVKIPGSQVPLAEKGGEDVNEFDFIGQVRDSRGKLVSAVRDAIRVRMNRDNVARLGRRQFQYDTGFSLPAGEYRLKFVARENRTGKMGTFETGLVVPDLHTLDKSLRISSVVWSNQREPLSAAVGAADSKGKLLAAHPLVHSGEKLIPSITRVFRRDQVLYVYLEAYDAGAEPGEKAGSVVATLSLFRDESKAFESKAVRAKEVPGRPHTLAIEFQIPLGELGAGPYTCQVNIVDEIARKFALPRASLVLLP